MEFWTAYLLVALFCLLTGIGEAAWLYRHDDSVTSYDLREILCLIGACFVPVFNWVVMLIIIIIFFGMIAPNIAVFKKKTQ